MQSLKLLAAAILIIGLSACPSTDISQSKFVKQSEICQTYNLKADEVSNQLSTTVFFRFGGTKGTTLVLNDSAGSFIKMGDKKLVLVQNSAGAYYSDLGEFIPSKKSFTFIDSDGKSYLNAINCEKFKVYNMPNNIDRNKKLELAFEGAKPEGSEQLICEYKDTSKNLGTDYIITEIKDNSLFIPVEVLQKMKTGPITLQFYRRNHLTTQSHGSLPGYLNYEYKGVLFKCNLTGKIVKPGQLAKNNL